MKVEKVSFFFENCEWCEVRGDEVVHLNIDRITDVVSVNFGKVHRLKLASEVLAVFEEDVLDKKRTWFGQDHLRCSTLRERLSEFNDIAVIKLDYEDGSEDSYSTVWKGVSLTSNDNQSLSKLDGSKSLYVLNIKES